MLGAIGYNVTAGAVQTAGVVNAILKSYTGVYFLGYCIAVAILFFVYPLTKQIPLMTMKATGLWTGKKNRMPNTMAAKPAPMQHHSF